MISIAWEYVAQYTNCTYSYGSAPERICIRSISGEEKAVVADKDTYVRYRGGIKSDVLEKAAKEACFTMLMILMTG